MPKVDAYPLGASLNWQPAAAAIGCEPHLYNWLLDTSSLTERLQSHCRDFRVQVLGQEVSQLADSEQQLVPNHEHAQVREVVLWGDEQPWIFARSVLPQDLLQANIDNIAGLGNQPLGKVIFNDRRFVRQPFEVTQLVAEHSLIKQLGMSTDWPLWGRRSLFCFQAYRLLVAEVFLPQSPAYKHFTRP